VAVARAHFESHAFVEEAPSQAPHFDGKELLQAQDAALLEQHALMKTGFSGAGLG
jgi:hypothetical protein